MIFNFVKIKCILSILSLLSNGKSKYSKMFKETKVSHTTLQNVLKELEYKKFIKKYNKGHQNVDYESTEKGKKLLDLLIKLESICK